MKSLAHDWVWGATSHWTRDAERRCGVEAHDETPTKPRRTVSYRTADGASTTTMPPCTRGDDEHATPAALAAVGSMEE